MPMDHEEKVAGRKTGEVWMNSLSTSRVVVLSVFLLLLISALDYMIEDAEVRFTIFYFIPVALVAWRLRIGWVVAFVVATSGICFFNYEIWKTNVFQWVDFWNLGVWCVAYSTVAGLVFQVRRKFEEQIILNLKLNQLIAEQEKLLSDVRRLQDDVLVMCAWSHKIKDHEKWISLEEFLDKHFNLKTSHGISPEELEKIQKTIEQPKPVREQ